MISILQMRELRFNLYLLTGFIELADERAGTQIIYPSIHSLHKELLSIYSLPGTALSHLHTVTLRGGWYPLTDRKTEAQRGRLVV